MNNALWISNLILWAVVIIQGVLIYFLARMSAEFLQRFRISGKQVERVSLKIGEKAPLFREHNQHGEIVRLSESTNEYSLLLFMSDTCNICDGIIPRYNELSSLFDLRLFALAKGSLPFTKPVASDVHLIRSDEIFTNYMIQHVPTLFLINKAGHIEAIESVSSYEQLKIYLQLFFRKNESHIQAG